MNSEDTYYNSGGFFFFFICIFASRVSCSGHVTNRCQISWLIKAENLII